jgi:hypothetical protein
MKKATVGTVAVAAAAIVAGRRLARGGRAQPAASARDRWHTITIFCEPERLGALPPPLDELGEPVEVNIRPAPGDHGTELSARLTNRVPTGVRKLAARARDDDPVRRLRRALREARSLAEVGEVLQPDTPPTTRPTPTGAPLAYATRHAREEGRL